MTQLRSVTCHMGSHSVTCYPTQVNTPRLNPSHTGRYSIYLPSRDGRLSWPSWLDSAPAGNWTSDLSITSPTLNQCNYQDNRGSWSQVIGTVMLKATWGRLVQYEPCQSRCQNVLQLTQGSMDSNCIWQSCCFQHDCTDYLGSTTGQCSYCEQSAGF